MAGVPGACHSLTGSRHILVLLLYLDYNRFTDVRNLDLHYNSV